MDSNSINDIALTDCNCPSETIVRGCIDVKAFNYSPEANQDNGSCYEETDQCDDGCPETDNDDWITCDDCAGQAVCYQFTISK